VYEKHSLVPKVKGGVLDCLHVTCIQVAYPPPKRAQIQFLQNRWSPNAAYHVVAISNPQEQHESIDPATKAHTQKAHAQKCKPRRVDGQQSGNIAVTNLK
jgi:hypothetical protein